LTIDQQNSKYITSNSFICVCVYEYVTMCQVWVINNI
jgi:hypothetical protein